MITTEQYFHNYLAYEMSSISSDSLSPRRCYYESFPGLDSRLVAYHAERDAHPGAMEDLGERHLYGVDGVKQDTDRAQELLTEAARLGHPDAPLMLAQIHGSDKFGRKDMDQYFLYLSKAAEMGSFRAMFNLSCAYYKGRDAYGGHGFDMDRAKALELGTQAAERAMELMGLMLTNPCSRSFQNLMQTAYQIFVQATCAAAQQYLSGDGVPASDGAAEALLNQAQQLHIKHLGRSCPDFTRLMA